MMHDHMTAMIGPMDPFSMSRVGSFSSHWNLLNLTPGAVSRGLRVSHISVLVFFTLKRKIFENIQKRLDG